MFYVILYDKKKCADIAVMVQFFDGKKIAYDGIDLFIPERYEFKHCLPVHETNLKNFYPWEI